MSFFHAARDALAVNFSAVGLQDKNEFRFDQGSARPPPDLLMVLRLFSKTNFLSQ
jgi:hypothetical protein